MGQGQGEQTLAPEPCVVPVQAGAEWTPGHKQLGARVVVAMGVDGIGERVDVREVAPPCFIMILEGGQGERHTQT